MGNATPENSAGRRGPIDVVVVGAGFAGVYLLHRLKQMGVLAVGIEAASDVGGTWYWNRYPGARCDVASLQYSYSFSPELELEWTWSELYAAQPEILRYIQHVADRLNIRPLIQFNTRVEAASFDDAQNLWNIRTSKGETLQARYCVMATGCLSASRPPEIKGLDEFSGRTFHTAQWPKDEVDFTGRTVGVIGTGSSAVQAIPIIAKQAKRLFVFQRTANFTVPARNAPLAPEAIAEWRRTFPERRETARRSRSAVLHEYGLRSAHAVSEAERNAEYERRWQFGGTSIMYAYNDLLLDAEANATAAEFVRNKIGTLVHDPKVAAKLMPAAHPIGAKRLCIDTDYYDTFNRPNVELVDVKQDPIDCITPNGLKTKTQEYALDDLVLATGFDAMTGALLAVDFQGSNGLRLSDKWAAGPRTYLGLMTAGFPNLFMVNGPGSPSVFTNMVLSVEHHVDWITDCLKYMRAHGLQRVEAETRAEDDWVSHVNDVAAQTLYPKAASWYMGANIPGKPRVFMAYVGGFNTYSDKCAAVASNNYEGLSLACGGVERTPSEASA